ncbi:hypothetical protein TNCV_2235221 [Trichonephila clavipes]|nr:hypothetical protein TNCV_2235221 [Trichonephila clavipes]
MESCRTEGPAYHFGNAQTIVRIQIVMRTVSNSLQENRAARSQFCIMQFQHNRGVRFPTDKLAECVGGTETTPNRIKKQD